MAEAEGIPPTASVVVPGLSLNYAGDWAYAYSGEIANSTSPTLQLSFHSGAGLLVADVSFMGTVNPANLGGGGVTIFAVAFNSQSIAYLKTEGNEEDMPASFTIPFFIPPFTKVEITADSQYDTSGYFTSVHLTGRVYDA
jgi:hypothetical protein